MTPTALLVALIGLALVAYWTGRSRALAVVGGARGMRNLHSLPSYYGTLTALWCALPALVVLGLWLVFQDSLIMGLVKQHLPVSAAALNSSELGLVLNDVRNVVAGNISAESARRKNTSACAKSAASPSLRWYS